MLKQQRLRATLLTDGSSDRALIPILEWLLRERLAVSVPVEIRWANFGGLIRPPKKLSDRIARALDLYPCEILFIHRDAERDGWQARQEEIVLALRSCKLDDVRPVSVVPVRMTEAWLLIDEAALRKAAGNRAGTVELQLPLRARLEDLAQPKQKLHDLLILASERTKRRRKRFDVHAAALRLASLLRDFSPLLALSSFQRLEEQTQEALTAGGYLSGTS